MLARMAIKFDNLLLICITLLNMLQIVMTAVVPSTEITTSGTIKYFKWDVEYIFWSPDCQENMVMGINGEFPGPTIRAKAGDQIIVELKNGLHTEGVVIHWHGIRQIGTPWADGTASISQCAINPGETFTYNFTVDKAGTYFYHGHYGMQRAAGLYGMLIVSEKEKEPFHYNEEFDLLLSDWYHNDTMLQSVGLYSKPFRWIGEPQSLLINGRGQYNCSVSASNRWSTCGNKNNQCAPIVLPVHPNKSYRLRIASTTSLASLNLAIQGHYMTVVEADGNYVEPFNVTDMDIYSGESYSVIITTKADASSNYWISVGVRGREPKTQPALAILNYLPNSPSKVPQSPPPITPKWNDYDHSKAFTYKIFAGEDTPKPPADYDHHIALLNTQSVVDGYKKWSINNISLVLPPTPYLAALKYRLSNAFDDHRKPSVEFPNDYNIMIPPVNPNSTQSSSIYRLPFHQTIDVILQNANALSENVSEIHPWHLHGHDFWVLGYGDGKFNRATDIAKFNLKNPPLRNTVVIFPYGWTAIRFVADNPGVWPFHCHIEPHLHMGMGVIFAEGIEQLKDLPKDVMGCGLSAKMSMEHLP